MTEEMALNREMFRLGLLRYFWHGDDWALDIAAEHLKSVSARTLARLPDYFLADLRRRARGLEKRRIPRLVQSTYQPTFEEILSSLSCQRREQKSIARRTTPKRPNARGGRRVRISKP